MVEFAKMSEQSSESCEVHAAKKQGLIVGCASSTASGVSGVTGSIISCEGGVNMSCFDPEA